LSTSDLAASDLAAPDLAISEWAEPDQVDPDSAAAGRAVRTSWWRRPAVRPLVAGCLAACCGMVALTSCGPGSVSVEPTRPSGAAAAACRTLVDRLPDEVAGADSRPVQPANSLAASWGDPPIVLRCGVAKPAELRPSSHCTEINGVGWFAERATRGYIFTTIGRAAFVEVTVPSEYEPPAAPLIDLAGAVRNAIPERTPCQ
jgi:Protein of unknown function (DUF3515)